MAYYYTLGEIPHKRHTQFRSEGGSLRHEELIGHEGFSGIQSLLYHLRPPTQIRKVSAGPGIETTYEPPGPLRPRHLRSGELSPGPDLLEGRVPLMGNENLVLWLARPREAMRYWYRFADGDEIIFVHEGRGRLESQLGQLDYRPGDYLVIPTGILWRLAPDPGVEQRMLVVEAFGHVALPSRYLNRHGQLLEHAPFCERDLRPPRELATHDERGEFEVRVKASGRVTSYLLEHHPLDVVGWDGHLWPYAFNIEDFEPITGRIHQPPPVHQTFEGPGFVLCSFVPRLFDYHPQAIPAPYNHSNVDTDEVLYYARGEFMSRKGIGVGSVTLHPRGIPHGPHPGTYEASIGKQATEELAVMIDTFRPLRVTTQVGAVEDVGYPFSWLPPE